MLCRLFSSEITQWKYCWHLSDDTLDLWVQLESERHEEY